MNVRELCRASFDDDTTVIVHAAGTFLGRVAGQVGHRALWEITKFENPARTCEHVDDEYRRDDMIDVCDDPGNYVLTFVTSSGKFFRRRLCHYHYNEEFVTPLREMIDAIADGVM